MKQTILLMALIMLGLLMPVYSQTGDIHINRNGIYLKTNEEYTLNVYMDTTMMDLGAYRLEVRFDPAFFDIPAVAPDGVPGFTLATNTGTAGMVTIAGVLDGTTIPPRQSDLLVLPLVVQTKSMERFTFIEVDVVEILDTDYTPILSDGKSVVQKCSIANYIPGDINLDNEIDIIDALLIAQEYVGLHPLPPVNAGAYDVNEDGTIDIVDALFVAQYYVRLLDFFTSFPATVTLPHPGQPTQPGDVLFFPVVMNVTPHQPVPVDLYMNTGPGALYGYQVTINYDPGLLTVDEVPVRAGSDGMVMIFNAEIPGTLVVSGYDPHKRPTGRLDHILKLNFLSLGQTGISPLHITVDNMFDENLDTIGTPTGIAGAVRITPAGTGDVNHDGIIDLQDALFIRKNGGTSLLPEADVNGDLIFTDADLQVLLEYTIGKTDDFYGLGPVPVLPPLLPRGTITVSPKRRHINPSSLTSLQLNLTGIEEESVTFDLDITYDNSMLTFVTGSAPDNFLLNIDSSLPGRIAIQGSGTAGTDDILLTLEFLAGTIVGRTPVTVTINQLQDAAGQTIGDLAPTGAEILIQDIIRGDVNEDSRIDVLDGAIIDMCMYSEGWQDYCHGSYENYDVNQDDNVDIIDVLLIAHYSAGIIDSFDTY